jgi:hypothetical protein
MVQALDMFLLAPENHSDHGVNFVDEDLFLARYLDFFLAILEV